MALALKFDKATRPFLIFDRRHWTLLESTERSKKGSLTFLKIDRGQGTILQSTGTF